MFGIGMMELLVILVLATIVLGPERMVEFAGQLARLLARFRAETNSITQEFREAFDVELGDLSNDIQDIRTEFKGVSTMLSNNPNQTTPQKTSTPAIAPAKSAETPERDELVQSKSDPVIAVEETIPEKEKPFYDETAEAEAIEIGVGQLVPEDEDVEPQIIDEPVLIQVPEEDIPQDTEHDPIAETDGQSIAENERQAS